MTRVGLGLTLLFLAAPRAAAQDLGFAGYALNVALGAAEGPFSPAGVQDVLRVRLMLDPAVAPAVLDLAYEQVLLVSSTDLGSGAGVGGLVAPPSRGDWLPLQGTITSGSHASWRHRLDRASLGFRAAGVEGIAGRQTISWGTTLFLTPADPFAPFDPADPFRDYRIGVDAARVRAFPSPLAEVEAVVRPATFGDTTTVTALGRGRFGLGPLDLSAWGGLVHDDPAGAVGVTLIVLDAAVRSELAIREDDGSAAARWALGADRSFTVAERTLYVVLEYQYDGFGAADAGDLPAVLASAPYRHGEMQVLGRHELAAQASYEIRPLIQGAALVLWNAGDGSVLLVPSLAWNAGQELTIRAGAFLGAGTDLSATGFPGSEYGIVPATGYVAGTLFF